MSLFVNPRRLLPNFARPMQKLRRKTTNSFAYFTNGAESAASRFSDK
jgi:hypothetical protein